MVDYKKKKFGYYDNIISHIITEQFLNLMNQVNTSQDYVIVNRKQV